MFLWKYASIARAFHVILSCFARHQWLMPVILATQEAEIRKIVVQS
jgi:hypothetical protein